MLEMPDLELAIPLRHTVRKRKRTALCTQQAWDLPGLERRVPGHVEFWFRYYSDYLGVDLIYFYDFDGSFEDLGILQELRKKEKLYYEKAIASIPPLPELFDMAGYKTSTTHLAQALVQQHCWQHARQTADWAA